jgi:hypothetical protein
MIRPLLTSATGSKSLLRNLGGRSLTLAARTWTRAALCLLAAGLVAALARAAPAPAGPDPSFGPLLEEVGRQAEKFWTYFPSVTCTERVTKDKIGDKGQTLSEERGTFDYLVFLESSGNQISVDESRLEKARTQKKDKAPLLETEGFSIFTLLFHPLYQSNYEFERLSDQTVEGRSLMVVKFQAVSTSHPLSVLRLRGREYPLAWRGTAWIDPASLAVTRIQAGLGDSLAEVGLLRLDAEVTYAQVHFNGSTAYWLPVEAVIDAETRRQHWRNRHVFSEYKRFDVETDVTIGAPK